ncbi:MAG TPA: tRNA pseudouridine(55) synthase TruB, partial [Novosphingobium sp.]|nr:tRNA pseudouridine(55) synthase TruB [Novosphingobium sp.]
ALMVEGRRAYDLARAGEAVELPARAVTIHALAVMATEGPEEALASATLRAHVSKGTYIRSLARDIALALGSCGHVTWLHREKAGPFRLEQAISLDKLNEIGQGRPLGTSMLPLEAGLVDIPALSLDPQAVAAVRQGRVLCGMAQADGLYWALDGDVPVALVRLEGGSMKVERGFNL